MLTAETTQSRSIDHLGLVAGMYDELGIGENIDHLVRQDLNARDVSIGILCKALVLDGPGFVQRTLYMVESFFEDKPVELLSGPDVLASQLNDSVPGRALDDIQSYGTTRLYSELVPSICQQPDLDTRFAHMDSTDFHLDGHYDSKTPPEPGEALLHLTQGYSRDHRPDLNQVVLNLITDNQAGIPLHMQALSGNSSDKTAFKQTIKEHIGNLKNVTDHKHLVMDSAGYTAETIASFAQGQTWISRVPETLSECRKLVQSDRALIPIDEKTSYHATESHYGGIKQRWLLIRSQEAYQREMKTLIKRTLSSSEKEAKAFDKLCRQEFSCEADAISALVAFEKKCRHLEVHDKEFIGIAKYTGKGRPARTQKPEKHVYHISANISCSVEKFQEKEKSKGKYVIATNELDTKALPDLEVLAGYKGQATVERGFRFLKDPWFMASSFFVKKPERVEALTFIMTLCLTVYAALEHKLRQQLADVNESIPDQVKKPTRRPTMRWVFYLFTGIHCLYVQKNQVICLNLKETNLKILALPGDRYKKYYLLN